MTRSSMAVAGLVLAAGVLLAAVPTAYAGAVFEIRERVPTNDTDLKFQFEDPILTIPAELGSVVRSGRVGAGNVFNTSIIPLTIFTLNKCVAVSPHIHPNGAETIFVLEGKVRIHSFRGETDDVVRSVDVAAGEAGYIQQGAVHLVENIYPGTSKFLQIFDHPQAGAVFVAPALAALAERTPNTVNSAFSMPVLSAGVKGFPLLIKVQQCAW